MIVPDIPDQMQRILVLGSTGSGKSTLAKSLAVVIGGKHIEMDSFRFLPGWQVRANEDFCQLVAEAASIDKWALDGNYGVARPITWPRADTAVFLDYPLSLVLWRITRRTIGRTIRREDLWGSGNRDYIWKHFQFSDESLYYWAIKHHQRRRREIPVLVQSPEYAHLRFVHLTSPRQTAAWLNAVKEAYRSA